MIILPIHPLPQKPKTDEPCNHCGLCCHVKLCPVAELIFTTVPCPAMQFKDGKVLCGLVELEIASGLEPMIQNVLGIGQGCSMDDHLV